MPQRLLQVTLPAPDGEDEKLTELSEELEGLFGSHTVLGAWPDDRREGRRVVQVALSAEESEGVMDRLEERYGGLEGFRLALLSIEALLPRPQEKAAEEKAADDEADSEAEPGPKQRYRISREELYSDVTDGLGVTPTYLAMVALSAIVAAVGLLKDDLAVVVGAMVIAPLLRPNVALALGTTLGDRKLIWRALLANAAGVAFALLLALAVGAIVPVDPEVDALASRTTLGLADLALALAAGAAGTLAFTRGLSGAVIGVMVAVALLPPLVCFGVLLGAGYPQPAIGALLLALGNTICINLAGIATFLLQGVRPRSWWEAERATRATAIAAALWILLLAALVVVLFTADLW